MKLRWRNFAFLSLTMTLAPLVSVNAVTTKPTAKPAAKTESGKMTSAQVGDLKSKLKELNAKITATKEQIKVIKNADFLIDLYYNLADLLADKSRVLYILKLQQNPNTPESEL